MRTVSISDLQSRLVEHIQLVKNGEPVLVCEQDTPVAQIVPCAVDDFSEQTRGLIAWAHPCPSAEKATSFG
jgi:antitoxin (DNA-binding transcriptional repressor) of toxin-antitoxin stability system